MVYGSCDFGRACSLGAEGAEGAEDEAYVRELKSALFRYLQPMVDTRPATARDAATS